MRRGILLASAILVGSLVLPAASVPVAASHVCDPYPIGRCGDVQRETVIFCYVLVHGRMVSATDMGTVAVGGTPPEVVSVDTGGNGMLYLRKAPSEAFLRDPWNAPLPTGTLYQETNSVPGLQPKPFRCGPFIWFAECEPAQWMHFSWSNKEPDRLIL